MLKVKMRIFFLTTAVKKTDNDDTSHAVHVFKLKVKAKVDTVLRCKIQGLCLLLKLKESINILHISLLGMAPLTLPERVH